jgi:hypothetical protein
MIRILTINFKIVGPLYRENLIKLNESLCNKLKHLFSIIGFSHIWENQGTFSKSKLLFSVTKQLENRYIKHWKTYYYYLF